MQEPISQFHSIIPSPENIGECIQYLETLDTGTRKFLTDEDMDIDRYLDDLKTYHSFLHQTHCALNEKKRQMVVMLYYAIRPLQDAMPELVMINQYIDCYNALLKKEDIQEMEIKKIDPNHIKKGHAYSTAVFFNFGFASLTESFKKKWELWGHSPKDFYHVQMVSKIPTHEKLNAPHFNHDSIVYIELHCERGAPIAQTDSYKLGKRTNLSYQDVTDAFVHRLNDKQLSALKNRTLQPHLRIRIVACYPGAGTTPNGMDSFCALFHRDLKERYGIYSEVKGETSNLFLYSGGIKTTKYGHEKEYDQRWEAYEKLCKELDDLDKEYDQLYELYEQFEALYLQAKKEKWQQEKKSLRLIIKEVKTCLKQGNLEIERLEERAQSLDLEVQALTEDNQVGSTVLFTWRVNDQDETKDEQVQVDGKRGGAWRAEVYQTIIHHTKTTQYPKQRKGLNDLLTQLDHCPDEPGMHFFLKDAFNQKEDPYGIRLGSRSSLLYFNGKTRVYLDIENLIEQFHEFYPETLNLSCSN